MGFSEQLKIVRNTMGYTQQQVADALGFIAGIYCGYETGKCQSDVAKLRQLTRIPNITGSFLLEAEPVRDTCQAGQETCHELMASYGKLGEHLKRTVDDLMVLLLDLQEKSGE